VSETAQPPRTSVADQVALYALLGGFFFLLSLNICDFLGGLGR
jgi:hypothetical protein